MKNVSIIIILIFFISFNSCKMAEVVLPSDSETFAYEVKGKRKIQWKKKISFGNYVAEEMKKTFAKKSSSTLSVGDFNLYEAYNERHTFQYEITNIVSNTNYNVMVTHNVNQTNFSQFKDLFEINRELGIEDELSIDSISDLNPKDYTVGVIKKIGGDEIYRFGISDVSRHSMDKARGYLVFDDRKISINEVEEVTKKGGLPDEVNLVYGLNFSEGEQYLGTVRTYGNGKVWIEKGLSSELKDLVATLSAMMLIKKTE